MLRKFLQAIAYSFVITLFVARPVLAAPTPGATFTTNSTCDGTNINIFSSKSEVYVDGGPTHPGSAGLNDGAYYVQVTEPNGTVLGFSVTPSVIVSDGDFVDCYQLESVLMSASSLFLIAGYDTTTNDGGEYKVWVSQDPTFPNSDSKTDNFKVEAVSGPDPDPDPPQATLDVIKFYDANVNGINDDSQLIAGWMIHIQDGIDYVRFTPVSIILDPDTYTVTEFDPIETNWINTTPNPVVVTLDDDEAELVEFGNVCVGAGGGHTLGFWSNRNGQALINDAGSIEPELQLLRDLHLRNANGTDFDPTSYAQFRTWLLGAKATNMAYMLSAQLAAMQLNVESGNVDGSAMVYAPTVPGVNALGFISIDDLMLAADEQLEDHGLTTSANDPINRAIQATIKTALDNANNNQNFVQATPCVFSFE